MKTSIYQVTLTPSGTPGICLANLTELTGKALANAIANELATTTSPERKEELAVMLDLAKVVRTIAPGDIVAGGVKLGTFRVDVLTVYSSSGNPLDGVSDDELSARGEVVELHRRHSPAILSYLVNQERRETKVALAAVACLFSEFKTVAGNVRASLFSQASRLCNELAA